jgi:hypothetical protein
MLDVGPVTVKEVCEWPSAVWRSLVDADGRGELIPGGLQRLHVMLSKGIDFSTAYSGLGGDALGLQFMGQDGPHRCNQKLVDYIDSRRLCSSNIRCGIASCN